jgi:cyclohexanone monooxygenase
MPASQPNSSKRHGPDTGTFDVVVVGAGFAGMYMLHKLRGLGLSARVYEQGDGVGGTWYWNRYPGARCDVESMQYSYSFSDELQQEWDWSEHYAPQPEILKYANHVADRFDLRRDIQFSTRVESAVFDESTNQWSVTTSDGKRVIAQFVVLATGCLSNARVPDIKGLADFKGKVYHTGHWPHEPVDFTGLRVGVIGTGSSGIQSVPVIAEQASHLTVFQRTANFSIPARNAALTAEEREEFRSNYPEIRRFAREEARNGIYTDMPDRGALDDGDNERRARYESRWSRGGLTFMSAYNNLALDKVANDTAADFVREKIAEIVKDSETAKLLQPNSHPIGTKRICIDSDYFAAFNRTNVTLVDTDGRGVERITEAGVVAGETEYELDCLIFATGFEVGTAYTRRAGFDVLGSRGTLLSQYWSGGLRSLHGMHVHGFPNMFVVSHMQGAFTVNYPHLLDQAATHVAHIVRHALDTGLREIEVTATAEDEWLATLAEAARDVRSFQEQCTPGYYNNEGQPDGNGFLGSSYGKGPLSFFELLAAWRQSGQFEGLELRL